ncbi:peptide/nickel transport system permease protein [Desulfonauticus submarinus]|uniref:Peptide/nickel transport system permease protein n=1 Tax=Desulfonauticus submarinus TaxID=206665 RepID=A0A1H0BDD6_9BACT|nr:ABC transporter permease [Desulfonauticus submarinus]SDN43640.1 peptide/nickel transport system permease protein [Desulfonauticus submarinus]
MCFRRLFLFILTLILLSIVSFSLFLLTPGDPADLIAWQRMGGEFPPPEVVEKVREELNLNASPFVLYTRWLKNYLHGNWGRSFVSGEEVSKLVKERFFMTCILAFFAFLISLPISISTGFICGIYRNKLIDTVLLVILSLCDALPNFFLGIVLMIIFSIQLGILPAAGAEMPKCLILPAFTLAVGYIAVISRVTRVSVINVLTKEYILFAQSKGLGRWLIFKRYIFRNALIPVITCIGLELGWLLEGSVIVETIFGWPGLGMLLENALLSKDLPVIQACIIVVGFVFALINLLTDISYFVINPEAKYKNV